jgi:hypothetical protein
MRFELSFAFSAYLVFLTAEAQRTQRRIEDFKFLRCKCVSNWALRFVRHCGSFFNRRDAKKTENDW